MSDVCSVISGRPPTQAAELGRRHERHDGHVGQIAPLDQLVAPARLDEVHARIELLLVRLGVGVVRREVLRDLDHGATLRRKLRDSGVHGIIERRVEPERAASVRHRQLLQPDIEARGSYWHGLSCEVAQRRRVDERRSDVRRDGHHNRAPCQRSAVLEPNAARRCVVLDGFDGRVGFNAHAGAFSRVPQAVDDRLPAVVEVEHAGLARLKLRQRDAGVELETVCVGGDA